MAGIRGIACTVPRNRARPAVSFPPIPVNASFAISTPRSIVATQRGLLAVICEAYTPDESRPSKVYMKFHPSLAPVKAGVFPLVNKDGMPEIAEKLYHELRGRFAIEFDVKQSIGKRYARMDEAGTPYCFTIDGQTLTEQTVTVRYRDTGGQERMSIDRVGDFLVEKIG